METAPPPATTPPPAADTPWTAQIFDPATPGAFVPGWQDKLPPDIFGDYTGTAAEATSLRDLLHRTKTASQAAMQKAGLRHPGADATPDQLAQYDKDLRALTGVPDDFKNYGLTAPEGGGIPWDDPEKGYLPTAHKLGLTPTQAKGLQEWYQGVQDGTIQQQTQAQQEAAKADREGLEKTYGPQLSAAVELAQRAAHGEGWPSEVFDPKNERFIGLEAFKLVHSLANKLRVASASDPFPGAGTVKNDPAGLEYARAVMAGNHSDSAAWRRGDPAIQKRVDDAYARAYTS